ncbi:MAG: TIGR03000 domain-containing protein [Gemmataceae bacterium]
MYSMVLLMAMSGPAAETPTWHHHHSSCCGGGANYACHGCGGCTGAANGGYGPIAYYGFAGCYGSCYGSYTNYFSYWSTPPQVHYGHGMPMPAPVKIVPGDVPVSGPAAPANVVVKMPEGAALFANGQKTAQTAAERRFVTPELPAGQVYHYVFTAEVERDGKTVRETKNVEVTAGSTVRVDFETPAQPESGRILIGSR